MNLYKLNEKRITKWLKINKYDKIKKAMLTLDVSQFESMNLV